LRPIATLLYGFLSSSDSMRYWGAPLVVAALLCAPNPALAAQEASKSSPHGATITGVVRNSTGKLVEDALVRIELKGSSSTSEAKSNSAGAFVFSALETGTYLVEANKSGQRSRTIAVILASQEDRRQVDLTLEDSKSAQSDSSGLSLPSPQAMEFADNPNFTISGVTDWTAAGGHGSDSTLRTSEALTRETVALKAGKGASPSTPANSAKDDGESERRLLAALAAAPSSIDANRQLGRFYLRAGRYREAVLLLQTCYQIDPADRDNEYDLALAYMGTGDLSSAQKHVQGLLAFKQTADLHRLAGELDEKLGDPLTSVHEFEQAVRMDPSEQNYFEWGSELLFHRAVWQAQEVFGRGAEAYPKSARMLTALGTAFFSSALYDQAALRLCDASDLNPADPEPYIFLGKVEMASPDPLTCVEPKLARFLQEQPANAQANYLYAMAILKHRQAGDEKVLQQAESLLAKSVSLDAKCADAYFELGILSSARRDFQKAIGFYTKAVQANPELADAYYRLGVAYDRVGDAAAAKEEFRLHDLIKKQQAAIVDRQRREVKQFLVVQPGKQTDSAAH